jgi:hypothetical protein
MYRGDTFAFTRTILDADGQPVDLSLTGVVFTLKRRFRDAPFLVKTLDNGIELGGSGDTGEVIVTIEPEDTADLTSTERFVWDIQYDDILTVATPFIGRLVVRLDVGNMAASGSGS